jgi:hypothetical protein
MRGMANLALAANTDGADGLWSGWSRFVPRLSWHDGYQRLQRVVGVVQLLATSAGKERQVVALVLVDGANDRRRLEDQLDELVADWAWQYVDLQTVEPAVATWRHLACEAARREQLAL